jgi:hypothetical protein
VKAASKSDSPQRHKEHKGRHQEKIRIEEVGALGSWPVLRLLVLWLSLGVFLCALCAFVVNRFCTQ